MSKENLKEVDRLVNVPATFDIGSKTVKVEALPAGAVTQIYKHRIAKAKRVDLDLLKKEANKGKESGEEQLDTIYDLLEKRLVTDSYEDYQLIRLMLIPAKVWTEKRGNFEKTDFPIAIEELEWQATELQLIQIIDEWTKRNPRFERQKKILEMGMEEKKEIS